MREQLGDPVEIAGIDPLGVHVKEILDLARVIGHSRSLPLRRGDVLRCRVVVPSRSAAAKGHNDPALGAAGGRPPGSWVEVGDRHGAAASRGSRSLLALEDLGLDDHARRGWARTRSACSTCQANEIEVEQVLPLSRIRRIPPRCAEDRVAFWKQFR